METDDKQTEALEDSVVGGFTVVPDKTVLRKKKVHIICECIYVICRNVGNILLYLEKAKKTTSLDEAHIMKSQFAQEQRHTNGTHLHKH